MDKAKAKKVGTIVGASLGGVVVILAAAKGVQGTLGSVVEKTETFKVGWGIPRMTRVFKPWARDEILADVGGGKSVPLSEYLNTIADPGRREIIRAQVYQAAGWYGSPDHRTQNR